MTESTTDLTLRTPFPAEAIGKLPRGGINLDYVGHAAVTDRLLTIDPEWNWEPVAVDEHGLPAYDRAGGLWIRLTVSGVTRLGYGDGADPKVRIGDAIRNAAMRFGVALDLWSKDELESQVDDPTPRQRAAPKTAAERAPAAGARTRLAPGPAAAKPPKTPAAPSISAHINAPSSQSGDIHSGSEDSPNSESRPTVNAPSGPSMRRLFALLGGKGIRDDDERHKWASEVLSREVTTFAELSQSDVSRLNEAASGQPVPSELGYAPDEEPFE